MKRNKLIDLDKIYKQGIEGVVEPDDPSPARSSFMRVMCVVIVIGFLIALVVTGGVIGV